MTSAAKSNEPKFNPARLRIRDVRGRYRYVRLRWRVLFTVIDALGWLLFWPAHVGRKFFGSSRIEPRRIRTILVIQLDHFGDAVLSTGLLHWLKQRFPAASLEILAASWNQQLFEQLTQVDRVHVLGETRFARRGGWRWIRALLAQAWRLRRRKYDLAIDVRGEIPHVLAMWVAGAKHRVGWPAGGGGFLLTHAVPFVPQRHEIASRAEIATVIAGRSVEPQDVAPRIDGRSKASSSVQELTGRMSPGAVALHIGAGTAAKMWPAESWVGLVEEILAQTNSRQVVLLGGPGEKSLAKEILVRQRLLTTERTAASGYEAILDLTGTLSISELPPVLQTCGVLVGADSGPAHLAAACGTPVLAIFSGTNHPQQWRPWGDHVTVLKHNVTCSPCHREICPLADHPCLQGVTPHNVLLAINAALATHQPHDQVRIQNSNSEQPQPLLAAGTNKSASSRREPQSP